MDDDVVISKSKLALAVYTLKQIDVRGFDSMDRLVGLVIELESWMQPRTVSKSNDTAKEPKK